MKNHQIQKTNKKRKKMPFSQEFKYNIDTKKQNKCNGCQDNCILGYTLCKYGCHIYPTIADKTIDWYINDNNELIYTAAPVCDSKIHEEQKKATIKLAQFIAKRCKHYNSK